MDTKKLGNRIAISVPEAAALIGISVCRAYELVHCGEMPAKKVGKRWLVSVKKLEEWINEA